MHRAELAFSRCKGGEIPVPRTPPPPANPRRAAMYVRMSTEHQQYSIANQADAIEKYAADHNLTIVKRFVDPGRSGLTLSGRPGLRQLLFEAISGEPGFSDVLVYDVSRWGRFQDMDESAFYEYTCKKANVKIHYCLEQFENDEKAYSTLIKALKRVMAAEYSRELSAKVFAGQARLVLMGYRQGGSAGYGLRRVVIDSDGKKKVVLKSGDAKAVSSDRVILVPGPKREVAVVRKIFDWYTIDGVSEERIAKRLNARKVTFEPETRWPVPKWSIRRVHEVLTNPKYIGTNVYNRTSFKLQQRRVTNAVAEWIRLDAAFTPIIPRALFEQAQKTRLLRAEHLTNEQILERLRDLLKREGRLSVSIINGGLQGPCACTIWARFGSLREAYRLIGYHP